MDTLIILTAIISWIIGMIMYGSYMIISGAKTRRNVYRKAKEAIEKVKESNNIDELVDNAKEVETYIEYIKRTFGTDSSLNNRLYQAKKGKLYEFLGRYFEDLERTYNERNYYDSFCVSNIEEVFYELDKFGIDTSDYKKKLRKLKKRASVSRAENEIKELNKKLN